MASYRDNKAFAESLNQDNLLDDAIDYITANLDPDDVFEESTLSEWAEANGYVKEDE